LALTTTTLPRWARLPPKKYPIHVITNKIKIKNQNPGGRTSGFNKKNVIAIAIYGFFIESSDINSTDKIIPRKTFI
jgi:hypothetical protein